jgi:hypothetical protein
MRFFLHSTTFLRSPDGEGGSGGGNQPPTRPDHVPEKFWDSDKGAVRVDDLAKSYGEAQKLIGKRASEFTSDDYKAVVATRTQEIRQEIEADRRKGLPADADAYKLELSADHLKALPEGAFDAEQLKDDPMVKMWRGLAHEAGLPQEMFANGIQRFLQVQHEAVAAQYEAEMKELGDNGKARIEAVGLYLDKHLPKEQADALKAVSTSAAVVGAIETLMRANGDPTVIPREGDSAKVTGKKSLAELKAMQQDKRYYHPRHKDPAYIAQVDEEWRKAFPGEVQIADGPRR